MNSRILLTIFGATVLLFVTPNLIAANYGMAGCGLGSLVFKDQPGKIQILASTTNNWVSPQTSGITSGTSNCRNDANETASLFITINKVALKEDASRASGETIATLSSIYQCHNADALGHSLQTNYKSIFKSELLTGVEINNQIKTVLKNDNTASCKIVS